MDRRSLLKAGAAGGAITAAPFIAARTAAAAPYRAEYRLSTVDAKARQFLVQEMEKFFFGDGSDKPKEFVPRD